MTDISGKTVCYEYDDSGRLKYLKENADDEGRDGSIISEEEEGRKSEYRYDLLNRQTYVKTLDGKEQENFYDGEGLRAGVSANGKKTTFLYHNGGFLQNVAKVRP